MRRAVPDARLPALDGLRGIAILLVLIYHYLVLPTAAPLGSPLARLLGVFRLSWSGVDLFFVLSGFLIGGILIDQRAAPRYWQAFYARRSVRILPLYYLNVALFYLLSAAGAAGFAPWLFDLPLPAWSYLTFTQNFVLAFGGLPHLAVWLAPTWSLAIEEQFYWMLPPLVRYLRRTWLPRLCVAAIVTLPLLRGLLFIALPDGGAANHVLMFTRADTLLMGVLVAYLWRSPRGWNMLQTRRRWLYAALAVLAMGLALLTLFAYQPESLAMALGGYTWLGLFYALLLVLALLEQNRAWDALLRLRWLGQLGVISYGVYLMHLTVLGILHAVWFGAAPRITNAAQALATLLALGVTLVLAALSWRYFERPLVLLGKSVPYATEARAADVAERGL